MFELFGASFITDALVLTLTPARREIDKHSCIVGTVLSAMETLGQIAVINAKIRTASTKAIRALHVLVSEVEGDHGNRKRLREFRGFEFADKSDQYTIKVKNAAQNLSIGDLISICNILALDYVGSKQDLASRICGTLTDLNLLALDVTSDDDSSDGDDDETVIRDGRRDDEQCGNTSYGRSTSERAPQSRHFSLSYKDVENTIRFFDDMGAFPVER